jgi:RimJ/RimL family protein N-acetyltransferase
MALLMPERVDESDERIGAPPRVALVGRSVALRPVNQNDYDFLRQAEVSEQLGPRWRFRGSVPAPEMYPQALWQGVTAQFAIVDARSPAPIGLVSLYNVEHAHGTGYIAVADLGSGGGPTHVVQGAILFLSYVFKVWNLRKLYAEAYEYNLAQFDSLNGRVLHEEGRLSEHAFMGGRYWDLVTLALYREEWAGWERRVLPRVLPRAAASAFQGA